MVKGLNPTNSSNSMNSTNPIRQGKGEKYV